MGNRNLKFDPLLATFLSFFAPSNYTTLLGTVCWAVLAKSLMNDEGLEDDILVVIGLLILLSSAAVGIHPIESTFSLAKEDFSPWFFSFSSSSHIMYN